MERELQARILSALCRKLLAGIQKETWFQSPRGRGRKRSNMLISRQPMAETCASCLFFMAVLQCSENMHSMAGHR